METPTTVKGEASIAFSSTPYTFFLSPDILGYIFFLNATDVSVEETDRAALLAACCGVCRMWRQIILEYSSLWSHVTDYHGPLFKIQKVIDLSHPSLLDYGNRTLSAVSFNPERNNSIAKLILQHPSRIRTFRFSERPALECWSLIQTELLQETQPNIEFLDLHVESADSSIGLFEAPLFEDSAPALHTLRLDGYICRLDLCPRILTNLSELQVKAFNPRPEAPTVYRWLELISSSPQLQWLVILDSISPSFERKSIPSISLPLNQLRMLYLRASQSDCTVLLQAVSLLDTCGIRIEATIPANGSNPQPLFSIASRRLMAYSDILGRQWSNTSLYSDTMVQIGLMNRGQRDSNIGISWCPGLDPRDDHSNLGPRDPFVSLDLIFKVDCQHRMPLLFPSLLDNFAFTYPSTTELRISIVLPPAQRSLIVNSITDRFHLFGKLANLELYDGNNLGPSYFKVPANRDETTSILLPSLRRIRFTTGDFHESPPVEFFDFVQWRKARGQPIEKLVLVETVLDMDHWQSQLNDSVTSLDMSMAFDPSLDTSDSDDE